MQEAIQPTISQQAADPEVAAAVRAEAWAGEPFLRDGENPAQVLAEGTARRRALDDAIAEIDAGAASVVPLTFLIIVLSARPSRRALSF